MPYELTWERKGVYLHFSGLVTARDIFNVNDEIYGSERFDRMYYQIADFMDVEGFDLSNLDAKVAGALDKASSDHSYLHQIRISHALPDHTIDESLKTYKNIAETHKLKIAWFYNPEEARDWAMAHLRPEDRQDYIHPKTQRRNFVV